MFKFFCLLSNWQGIKRNNFMRKLTSRPITLYFGSIVLNILIARKT